MARKKRKQFRFHECIKCGYSLKELRYQRCPECGWFPKTEDFDRARWQSRICTKRYLSLVPSRFRKYKAKGTEREGTFRFRSGFNIACLAYISIAITVGYLCSNAISLFAPDGISIAIVILSSITLTCLAVTTFSIVGFTRRVSLEVDTINDEVRYTGPWYNKKTWRYPRRLVRVTLHSHSRFLQPSGGSTYSDSMIIEECISIIPWPAQGRPANEDPFIMARELYCDTYKPSGNGKKESRTNVHLEFSELLGIEYEVFTFGSTRSWL